MTNAKRDQNHVTTKLGVLCTDGVTLIPIALDSNQNVKVDTVSTISFDPATVDLRDENLVTAWMGVRSDDTSVVCPIYVNADGAILVDL